jgi:HK97 family phage portal protein
MSGKQLLEGTQMWMEIHGNAFWYLSELDRQGQPKEIWLLDSRNMSVVPDMKNLISGYVYEVNGKQIPLDLDEVIHFKSFNPFNPFMGMGTLQAIGAMLETEQYRDDYDKAFFKNGAVLSGVLQTPKTLSKAVFDRLKREFRAVYGGARNAHKIAVFEEGLEFKQITLSQRDMEFLEMARFNRDRILAAFGVPPSKLGLVEDANRANSEAQDKTFMSETMFPKLADLEERINNELSPRYGRDRVAFDEVVKEDEGARVQEVVSLAGTNILTTNELREWLGYDPLPEGDNPQPPTQPDTDEEDQPEDTTKSINTKDIRDTFQRSRVAYLARVRKEFTPDLQRFFDKQEERILNRMFLAGKSGKQYNFIPAELWDEHEENEELLALLAVLFLTVAKSAYKKAGTFFDRELTFDTDNPIHAELIKQLGDKITRINDTTREQVNKQVLEGIRRGYSINQIAHGFPDENYKGIAGVFDQARGYRAEMIARSEASDAYNLVTLKAYKGLGQTEVEVIDGVDWDAECREANGQIWTIEKALSNLKDHPNCTRCFSPYIRKGGP